MASITLVSGQDKPLGIITDKSAAVLVASASCSVTAIPTTMPVVAISFGGGRLNDLLLTLTAAPTVIHLPCMPLGGVRARYISGATVQVECRISLVGGGVT